jgi:hypothetical protein
MRRSPILLALFSVLTCVANAEDASHNNAAPAAPAPVVISPIFGQLVMFTLPSGFVTAFEQPSATSYIREAVLRGETVDAWSQMVTVTGVKGLAEKPGITAQYFAAQLAAGFQKACPTTFAVKPLGPTRVAGGEDAFVAIASCGKLGAAAQQHSETALIVAIKGTSDVYTVQWAERTPSNAENLTIDESKWKSRLEKLAPVRLCPIIPNEPAPYPSCTSK